MDFSGSSRTGITVIIPVFNKWDLTRACLESLYPELGPADEVIVVDNASTDATSSSLGKSFPQCRHLRQSTNLGYAKANNIGAREARGQYLLLLNNDTVLGRGTIQRLLNNLQTRPGLGAVGCKLLYPDRRIQHAGLTFTDGLDPMHIYRNLGEHFGPANRPRLMQAVTGACMMLPAAVFEEMQGFDEDYVNGFEDLDLCMRLQQKGYGVWYEPEVSVVHYESQTPGRFRREASNSERFAARFRPGLTPMLHATYTQDGIDEALFPLIDRVSTTLAPERFVPCLWTVGEQTPAHVRELVEALIVEARTYGFDARVSVDSEPGATKGAVGVLRPASRWFRCETHLVASHRVSRIRPEASVPGSVVLRLAASRETRHGCRWAQQVGRRGRYLLEPPLLMGALGFSNPANEPGFCLGQARRVLKDQDVSEAGEACLREFQELFTPDGVEARMLAADICWARGERAQARALYEECLQRDPGQTYVTLRLAEILRQDRETARARKLLVDLLRVKPACASAYRQLLRCWSD